MTDEGGPQMTLVEHLEELRKRLKVLVLAVMVAAIVAFVFREQLLWVVKQPLLDALPEGQKLHVTGLLELFIVYLKLSVVAGVFFAAPLILQQIWGFIGPALYPREKKLVVPFVIFGTLFFVGGAVFGYFVVFPFGFQFFIEMVTADIEAIYTVKEYYSLAMRLLVAFGLVFETPLVVFFLAYNGIVKIETFKRMRRYTAIGSFVVASIITPPDVITQLFMAGPLIVLYEVGLLTARILRGKHETEADEDASEPSDDEEASTAGADA